MEPHYPANMRMAAKRMSNYNRNRFRLETVSAETSGPGRIVTVNLPENALLDMKSFKMHLDVLTTSAVHNGTTVYGRLPADASSLLSRVEVYLNGIQVQQGAAEYNTICRVLKIGRSSRDKDGSIDRALSHGAVSVANAIEDVSLCIADWKGFLGETSTRFLPTDLLGQIQVRLTFAGNDVLVPRATDVGLDTNLSADAQNAAANISYSVSNMFFTIDSIQVDEMYSQMLRQRLTQEEYIPINYREYYSFSLDNITTGSHTSRFSLSAQSIDKLYGTFRDSNHQTVGVRGSQMQGATFTDNLLANAFRFRSFDSSETREGHMRYQFSINNVKTPQYRAGIRDALFDVGYAHDKVHEGSQGTLVTSMESFHDGLFIVPLRLNHPGEPIAVQSGYNSKGINTMLTLEVTGQVPPTISANAQTTASISSFIVAQTTAQLRVGLGKSVAISF